MSWVFHSWHCLFTDFMLMNTWPNLLSTWASCGWNPRLSLFCIPTVNLISISKDHGLVTRLRIIDNFIRQSTFSLLPCDFVPTHGIPPMELHHPRGLAALLKSSGAPPKQWHSDIGNAPNPSVIKTSNQVMPLRQSFVAGFTCVGQRHLKTSCRVNQDNTSQSQTKDFEIKGALIMLIMWIW